MSSPSSLTLDFLGLSLVDTPPADEKGHRTRRNDESSADDCNWIVKNRDSIHRLEDNIDDTSEEKSCEDSEDDSIIQDKALVLGFEGLNRVRLRESFNSEESTSTHIDLDDKEGDSDSVWIFNNHAQGYILNDRCSTFDANIRWPNITLSKAMHAKLYPHQKIGVRWLASLHYRAEQFGIGGGALLDDMGLGKTIQTLTYLGGLFKCQTIRNALVICPLSVVQSWKNEADSVFDLCGISARVSVMVVDSTCRKGLRASKLNFAMIWYVHGLIMSME